MFSNSDRNARTLPFSDQIRRPRSDLIISFVYLYLLISKCSFVLPCLLDNITILIFFFYSFFKIIICSYILKYRYIFLHPETIGGANFFTELYAIGSQCYRSIPVLLCAWIIFLLLRESARASLKAQ